MKELFFNLKMWYQKKTRGYSDIELWNLDITFAEWILPRLKEFKARTDGYPGDVATFEEWQEMLDTMIKAFELYIKDFNEMTVTNDEEVLKLMEEEGKIMKEGFELFGKRFVSLWW